jgi:CRP-like cAMP-binding protein
MADRLSGARLLELMPELFMNLAEDELELASRLLVPVCAVRDANADIQRLLVSTSSFAASVLDGMLTHRMQLRGQAGLRLLVPGDIIVREGGLHPGILESSEYGHLGDARVVLLGDHLLHAARRYPQLMAGLMIHLDQQSQRLTTQLMICQLPRVEERVLAIMWLLADTLGRVTRAGTILPLRLTHQQLGELVGARRQTVTLALKQLADRGALRRQQHGWLLLERVAGTADHARRREAKIAATRAKIPAPAPPGDLPAPERARAGVLV